MFKEKVVLAIILTIAVLGFLLYIKQTFLTPTPKNTACTADAMICPDGSYVGRVPPNCEFQKCPEPLNLEEVEEAPTRRFEQESESQPENVEKERDY